MLKDILKILENDARITATQISAMTGTPRAEVAKLIKQAEKDPEGDVQFYCPPNQPTS